MKKLLLFALLFVSLPAFGQKISNLPSAATPTGGEFLPMVQAGATVKVTPLQLLTYIAAQGITWSSAQQMDNGLTVLNGLTLSSGNLGVTSGSLTLSSGALSVAGTSTLTGAVTASNGLTATAGGVTITAGGLTVNGGGASINSGVLAVTSADANFTGDSGMPVVTSGSGVTARGGNAAELIQWNSIAPTDNRAYDSFASGGGALAYRLLSDDGTNSTIWLQINRNGLTVSGINFPRGVFEVGGNPVETYGLISVSGTTCSLNSSVQNSNIASCTRTAAGDYTVSFITSFSSGVICTVSYSSAGVTAGVINTGTATTTSIEVYEGNSSFTQADVGSFNLICK
jgi:hypothetical protein